MNSKYLVSWTQFARDDLMEIAQFIAKDSVKIALEKMELIEDKVKSLSSFPFEGKNVPELEEYDDKRYKQIIVHPWRIIYSMEGNTVCILMVIDGRRNLQDILYKKLVK